MRKLISILLLALMLLSGVHLSVSNHTCGGQHYASKVSFSEQNASCGMARENEALSNETSFNIDCCHNILSVLSVDSNFQKADFSFPPAQELDLLIACNSLSALSELPIPKYSLYTNVIPPGNLQVDEVYLSHICVFII